jgi:Xaa-Pro aminopeptidase
MPGAVEEIRRKLEETGADAFVCYHHPNYRYLSGFTGSLAILIIARSHAVILSDFRYREQIAEQVADFDFVEIKGPPEETVIRLIEELDISKVAFESAHLTYQHYAQLRKVNSVELIPTENWVEDLRAVKEDREVDLIEKAASIADATIEKIADEIRPGTTEQEAANRINELIRAFGAKKEAFDAIVASGPRSSMPHATSSERRIQAGEPIVVDIGAQFDGYHSDLTRTIWLDRMRTSQVLELYEVVENAQAAAIKAIRPDMPCAEIDAIARNLIAEAGYGEFFGHGLGHGVGLEVHESPIISRLGKGNVKPGMVFTVEPGIYIPEVGGIRIEDMILVTDDGCRLITKSAHRPEITL